MLRFANHLSNQVFKETLISGCIDHGTFQRLRGTKSYAVVTTGILQIRWTDDGDRDVAALATMYIAEVPNESSVSQRSFHRMS